jgi:hypothetical protein
MEKYYVKYQVEGFGEHRAGPYESLSEAQSHKDDIAGFEGVSNAQIETRKASRFELVG